MTDEELAAWGREENHRRQKEMANVSSEHELKAAQQACQQRRKRAGLTAGQAAFAVVIGQRLERGQSLSRAMRRR